MANLALTSRSLPVRGVALPTPRPAPIGVFLGVVGLVFAALLMGGLTVVGYEQLTLAANFGVHLPSTPDPKALSQFLDQQGMSKEGPVTRIISKPTPPPTKHMPM